MNLKPIKIKKVNETYIKVECPEIFQEMDIQDKFSFETDNPYDPRIRAGKWDGIIKLYNRKTRKLYSGLLYELLQLIASKKWPYEIDPELIPTDEQLTEDDLTDIIDELIKPHDKGEPLTPYDFQMTNLLYIMNMGRTTSLAATSAGKSLIIYIAARLYQLLDEMQGKNIFIVVPSIALVEQLYSDFENYSTFPGSNWHVNKHCQKVNAKYPKFVEKQIVITTWQSMKNMSPELYEELGCVFVDECHTAQADVLKRMIESATKTPFRHGLTGTLDDFECNKMVVQGLLGPAKKIVTAKELIDQGRASTIKIKMLLLQHPPHVRQEYREIIKAVKPKQRYGVEINYLNSLEYRRKLILDMIEQVPGNTIVLFDRVEEYGKELYEDYKNRHPETTFLIVGDVEADERENIRLSMENYDNATIFANFQCMSTGVSIKKLHNAFFVSSSKSKFRILQSLGRLMRLHETKTHGTIYDIVDNLSVGFEENYVFQHAKVRLEKYSSEQHQIKFVKLDIKDKDFNTL